MNKIRKTLFGDKYDNLRFLDSFINVPYFQGFSNKVEVTRDELRYFAPSVAIRSSSLNENNEAGENESFLNIENSGDILYQYIKSMDRKIPIIVQDMIQPDYSGIAMISDSELVLSLTHGTSEKLTAGIISGITIKIDLDSGEIFAIEDISDYNLKLIRDNCTIIFEKYGHQGFLNIEFAVTTEKFWALQARILKV